MIPEIKQLTQKNLVGLSVQMSFAENRTHELWRNFMPRRKEISNTVDSFLYSLQVYPANFFVQFNPTTTFTKYAAVEISDNINIPEGLELFIVSEGLYAVFTHKGSSTDTSTYEYIFTQWLPACEYEIDDRPHFELLGEKYKNNDPHSEEEYWIPIKPKVV